MRQWIWRWQMTKKLSRDVIERIVTAPNDQPIAVYNKINKQIETHPDWAGWFKYLSLSYENYHDQGVQSVLLNSDFNFNRSITTPITQASGDGANFSEKWQIQGASVATYSLTLTDYDKNSSNQTGSLKYVNWDTTAYTSGEYYLYQRFSGDDFLRLYQGRDLTLSIFANNKGTNHPKMQFEVYFYHDTTNVSKKSQTFLMVPGENIYFVTVRSDYMDSTIVVGASPYVDFRTRMLDIDGGADIDLFYIKGELANYATPLWIDHPLEQTRIDNS